MTEEKLIFILKESGRIFQQYGIRNVSMDDISRELGMSKKTLYQYVENKADLIQKILEYHHLAEKNIVVEQDWKGKNAIDVLLSISQLVCENMKGYKPILIFELQKYYPDLFRNFFDIKKQSVAKGLRCNLKSGIEQGLYRQNIDIEVITQLYVQNMQELHGLEMLNSGEVSFEKVFQTMFDSHIRGIVNQQGLEYYEKIKGLNK
ncbi:MAG: TetR/AcrR family transcriptional regulator [Bacteroidetes bacterium]|nr:TetR/AcrR family transcriptional regulator [Bacteroidota bacterium]